MFPDKPDSRHTARFILREGRRSQFWRAAVIGTLAGFAAVLFQWALEAAELLRSALASLVQRVGLIGGLGIVVFSAAVAGLAGWITLRFAPEAAGSGIPHVKGVLIGVRSLRWFRVMVAKFIGGFLAISAGLSLGREGPTVHIGACVAKGVGEKLRIPKRSYRTLIAAGAGAGLTAAFNAPLAGFIFVLEEMQRDLTPTTYGAALIASVCADAVTRILIGERPAFRITGYPGPSMHLLPIIALLGVLAGLLGVLFNKCLLASTKLGQRFGWQKAVLVGAIAGIAAWQVPAIAGGGHGTAEIVLSGQFAGAIGVLLLLMIGKFVLTMLSYGAGVPGGIFAPMLVIGAFLGLAFGNVAARFLPDARINSAAFAVLGMAALFSGSVRAPLTGIVLIVEMTANYNQLYALIVASLSAYLVAEGLRDQPIYDALLDHDVHRLSSAGAATSPEPLLTEVFVERGSYLDGRQFDELDLPAGCAAVSVLRGSQEFAPPTRFHIKAGDVVVFVADSNNIKHSHQLAKLARQ